MAMPSTNAMNSPPHDSDLDDDTTDKSTIVFVHEDDSSRGSPFSNNRDGQSDSNDDWDNVTEIRDYDCLLGRGGGANKNMGNVKFRELIKQYKFKYLAAAKIKKPKVAEEVVHIWRNMNPPGRFLARKNEGEKNDDDDNKDKKRKKGKSDDEEKKKDKSDATKDSGKEDVWYDVGDKRARAKASMALRERTPDAMSYVQRLREHEDAQAKQSAFLVQQKHQMHHDAAQARAAGLRHPMEQQYLVQAQPHVAGIHNFQLMNQQQQQPPPQQPHPTATPFLTRQGSDVALCAGLSDMHMTQDPTQQQHQRLLGTSGAADNLATNTLHAQQQEIHVRTMEQHLMRKQDELESFQQRLIIQRQQREQQEQHPLPGQDLVQGQQELLRQQVPPQQEQKQQPLPGQDLVQRQQELLRQELPSQPQSPPQQRRSMNVSPNSLPVHSPSSSESLVTSSSSNSPIASPPIEDSNKPLPLSAISSMDKKHTLTQDDRNMELYRSLLENYFDREIREDVDSDIEDEWGGKKNGGGGTPPQGESLDTSGNSCGTNDSSNVLAPLPHSLLPPQNHNSRRPPRRSGSSNGSGGLMHPGGPQRRGVSRKESNISMQSTGSGMGSVRSDDGSAVTDLMAMSIISAELDGLSVDDYHDDEGQSMQSL